MFPEEYECDKGCAKMSQILDLRSLRKELRASIGDHNRLSKLHAIVTDNINSTYGEEKTALVKFRQEIKDAIKCRVPDLS